MKGILERQEEKLSEYMLTVRKFTYLGDGVSIGGRCETAVITRTIWMLVMFREWGVLLYLWRFYLRLKGSVYESYVRPAVLYGSEA